MDGKVYCYEKIENYIIDNIQHEKYIKGKIESEYELCKKFNTSRMTVRHALTELQDQGYIYTIPKKGSYVSHKKNIKELDGLRSFTEDFSGDAYSQVLTFESIDNPGLIMNCEKVWHIERIRYGDKRPIAYEEGFINQDLLPDLSKEVLEHSLYQYIEDNLHYQLDCAKQEITAMTNKRLCKILDLTNYTPLLKIKQVTYLQQGECIEICDSYYTSDQYTFKQNAYRRKN